MAEDVNKIHGQPGFIDQKIDPIKVPQTKFSLSELCGGGISHIEMVKSEDFEDYSKSSKCEMSKEQIDDISALKKSIK